MIKETGEHGGGEANGERGSVLGGRSRGRHGAPPTPGNPDIARNGGVDHMRADNIGNALPSAMVDTIALQDVSARIHGGNGTAGEG